MNENMINNVFEGEAEVMPAEIAEVRNNPLMVANVSDFTAPAEAMMYCTIANSGSMKDKAAIFNAVNSPEKRIADCIGETIYLKDIIAHPIKLVDENTGELMEAMRMVLISDKGVSYEAVSSGLVNAVQRILQIFGQPSTWEKPIPVKPIQKSTRNGNNKVTTLKVEM